MAVDSVSLESVKSSAPSKKARGRCRGALGWKQGLLLFAILLFAMSDLFVNSCVSYIPGAVAGRVPTDTGYLVQAVAAVVLYATTLYLIDEDVL